MRLFFDFEQAVDLCPADACLSGDVLHRHALVKVLQHLFPDPVPGAVSGDVGLCSSPCLPDLLFHFVQPGGWFAA